MIRNSENLEVVVSRMVGKSEGAILARKRDTEAKVLSILTFLIIGFQKYNTLLV